MDTDTTVGSVASLWRYPVKSMQGEELNAAVITERGLLGDRAYALVDKATGHVASAKHPRKWGKLFECRAAFAEPPRAGAALPPVWITLPDGAVTSSADPDVDRALSRALGRDVTLVREAPQAPKREADRSPVDGSPDEDVVREEDVAIAAPPGTFFDCAVLHVLTTATLDKLRELYPAGRFEARRFRPNLVVAPSTAEPGFVENGWVGHALAIGSELRVSAIDPCPRCVVTTLAQGDLPRDPGILRALGRHSEAASVTLVPGVVLPAVAGFYASVRSAGSVRRGDPIALEGRPARARLAPTGPP